MKITVQDRINFGGAIFKWVQHEPIGELKKLEEHELETILENLIKEAREVSRALHWVNGIITLKKNEEELGRRRNKHEKK